MCTVSYQIGHKKVAGAARPTVRGKVSRDILHEGTIDYINL